jgi:hypothetical protein
VPYHGEEHHELLDLLAIEAHEMMEEFGLEDEIEKFKNAKKMRNLLDGCKFSLRVAEVKFQLFSEQNKITREKAVQSCFSSTIDMISVQANAKKLTDSTANSN